ncbi:MAG: hypothetical protein K1Y02_05675 [Candidatus Hydrogenedentes bacterium]|nr:hypothetical protein [Candidatus Hydrogenedentota bacterium]
MKRLVIAIVCMSAACVAAHAQGVVGDFLSGKLVNPKVGQWAWYDLIDSRGGQRYVVRQAIVGEEEVGNKDGYWVEFEIVPEVGYKIIYKMLLTGPTSDPANIHRVIEKLAPDPARELALDTESQKAAPEKSPKRKSQGMDSIDTLDGKVRAEHYEIVDGEKKVDLWINDQVTPSGVVRMRAPDGEMTLRNYGIGGKNGESSIKEPPLSPDAPQTPREPKVRLNETPEKSKPEKPNQEPTEQPDGDKP